MKGGSTSLEVLRERNFRFLFAARTISFFGTNLAPIAVAFAVLGLTGSATDVGLSFAAWTLAQVATLLVGGVAGDRLPRRLVMIASDSASFVLRVAMGTLFLSGHAQMWEVLVLQALGGAAVAFHSPALTGLVPETVPQQLLQQANSFMNIARYAAFPVGAVVGGTLVATVGAGWALLLDGLTYGVSAFLLSRMRLPGSAKAKTTNFVQELREGWQAFTEHTWVWLLTGWIALYFLITYAPFFVLGPYVAKQSLGGAAGWTVVVTGEAIGALAGGLGGLRIRPRRPMVTSGLLFALTSVQVALLALRAPVAAIACGAALAGFAFSFGSLIWDTEIQRRIAPEKLSRVIAYCWMAAMACLPAGYAVAGPVSDLIGISTSLWIGVGWILASTAAVLCVRDVRELRAVDEPAEADAVAVLA